jgi:hypothetical protein
MLYELLYLPTAISLAALVPDDSAYRKPRATSLVAAVVSTHAHSALHQRRTGAGATGGEVSGLARRR